VLMSMNHLLNPAAFAVPIHQMSLGPDPRLP
jgi:hypothetical protein